LEDAENYFKKSINIMKEINLEKGFIAENLYSLGILLLYLT
jgi:hypothetical protein